MTLCLLLVPIYLISAYYMYKYFQKAYSSPIGKWSDVNPEYIDVVAMFLPVVNTFLAITFVFETPYTDEWEKEYRSHKIEMKRKFLYKFFNIHHIQK